MIATLAQLKVYLWISTSDKDTILQLFLDGANAMVNTFLWRTIESASYTDIIDGNGQLFLVLPNYPVSTFTSVSINTWTIQSPVREALDKNSYSVNSKTWKINFLLPLNRWFQNYKLIYTAWYTSVPADLVLAVCKLANKYYSTKSADWIKSESVAGDSISFDVSEIPNDILAVLSNYRNM